MTAPDPAAPVFDLGDVRLRPVRLEDAPAFLAYLDDDDVRELTSYAIHSLEDAVALTASWVEAGRREGHPMRWAIEDASSGETIGSCGFVAVDWHNRRAEIGYDLAGRYWGQRIMPRVARRLVDHATGDLGLHRLEATVLAGNTRSARVLDGLGFELEGALRDYKYFRGAFHDFWLYARVEHRSRRGEGEAPG